MRGKKAMRGEGTLRAERWSVKKCRRAAITILLAWMLWWPALGAAGVNGGRLSLSLGSDIATQYFFRGIIQENDGFILQPYVELSATVHEGEGALGAVTATGGIWNSVHSEQTGASGDGGPRSWYEADLYAGISADLFDVWSFGTTYIAYTSPNNAFSTIQEVDFALSYDDAGLLGAWALSPSATLAVEYDNTAFGPNEGVYLELGVGPGFTLLDGHAYPVSVSFPITLGLGLDDYYEATDSTGRVTDDDTFGFVDAGIVASVPLAAIPEAYGSWEATAGVHFLTLGNNLETANGGDEFEVLGLFGLSLSY